MLYNLTETYQIRAGNPQKRDIICKKDKIVLKDIYKIIKGLLERESFILAVCSQREAVIATCLFRRFSLAPPKDILRQIAGSQWYMWLVLNYRPPVKVIFCGDRNSTMCFEEYIEMELNRLPPDSVVIHGGCKGIDLYTENLCQLRGIQTKSFPVTSEDWNIKGLRAGPERNAKMLDEDVHYVVAFHPDIKTSKGTKNMMLQAHNRGIPVYIHDLKTKVEFDGSFDNL